MFIFRKSIGAIMKSICDLTGFLFPTGVMLLVHVLTCSNLCLKKELQIYRLFRISKFNKCSPFLFNFPVAYKPTIFGYFEFALPIFELKSPQRITSFLLTLFIIFSSST